MSFLTLKMKPNEEGDWTSKLWDCCEDLPRILNNYFDFEYERNKNIDKITIKLHKKEGNNGDRVSLRIRFEEYTTQDCIMWLTIGEDGESYHFCTEGHSYITDILREYDNKTIYFSIKVIYDETV